MDITVARPYAKAAFDCAIKNNKLEHWSQMMFFMKEAFSHEIVSNLLNKPMSSSNLAKVLVAICGEQIDEKCQNFIKILAENKRLKQISVITEMFFMLLKEYQQVTEAEVISAKALSDEQVAKITQQLEKRLSKKVNVAVNVDKSLLSGVIIRAGDTVIDNSARGRLSRLNEKLHS